MASFCWLYIGLGAVLGFIVMGIVAELYYLLWRKKKRISTAEVEGDGHTKGPLHPTPSDTEFTRNPPEIRHGFDPELGCGEDLLLTTAEAAKEEEQEEELELMGLYNLAAQPRFLFTINEESKEDLESEDSKSRGSRNRSLSEIITPIETPYFTPMASPPLKASSLSCLDSYKLHGSNPLFESSSSSSSSSSAAAAELEQNLKRLRSSPPPKLKFLRDAEEKLYRRLMEEAQRRTKNERRKPINTQRFHSSSSSSQVLPLVSSPPEIQTLSLNNLII